MRKPARRVSAAPFRHLNPIPRPTAATAAADGSARGLNGLSGPSKLSLEYFGIWDVARMIDEIGGNDELRRKF